MKTASIAEVQSRFSAFLKASEDGPVVITRNGRPVAVLQSVGGVEELDRLVLTHTPRFQAILETARQQVRDGLAIGHDEFWEGANAHGRRRPPEHP